MVRQWLVPAAAFVLSATVPAQHAAADEFDTLNFSLSDSVTYDANVFRTPDSTGPQPGFATKADRIYSITAGLKVDKPYAQQRFQVEVTKSLTRFDVFTFLDSDSLNYRAAWLWAATPHLTGTLSTDKTEAQVPFTQAGGTRRNLRSTTNRNFSLDGWLAGGWHMLVGVGQSESVTEQTILSQPSYESHRAEAGLRYVMPSGNSIAFMQRYIPADTVNQPLDPVNFIDTKYIDMESELKAAWRASGNSSFDGTLNRKERRNEHFVQRNFSGMTGELRYTWTPTGRLLFNFTASRNLSPYAAFGNTLENSTYKVDETLSLLSSWTVATKATVRLNLARTVSDFRGPVFAITRPARHDELRVARLSFDWLPIRNLTLSASLERDLRSSNVATFQFSDTLATVSAALTF